MIDLDYFCWREATKDADGKDRLLVPWSDPMLYEHPFDMIFASEEEAIDYKLEAIEQGDCILTGADGENDDDCMTHEHEPAEGDDWVLVHYRGIVVPKPEDRWHAVAVQLDRIRGDYDALIALDDGTGDITQAIAKRSVELHSKLRRIMKDNPDLPEPLQAVFRSIVHDVLGKLFKVENVTDDALGYPPSQPQEKIDP